MLLGGDALEVKKFEHISNDDLPLNSSYPKDVLHSNNPLLTETCKTCEQWTVKDIAYHIGFLTVTPFNVCGLPMAIAFVLKKLFTKQ